MKSYGFYAVMVNSMRFQHNLKMSCVGSCLGLLEHGLTAFTDLLLKVSQIVASMCEFLGDADFH